MNNVTVTCEGGELVLSEIELARGRRELAAQLREIRATCPAMRVVDDFELAPIMIVAIPMDGHYEDVIVDPLRIIDRTTRG